MREKLHAERSERHNSITFLIGINRFQRGQTELQSSETEELRGGEMRDGGGRGKEGVWDKKKKTNNEKYGSQKKRFPVPTPPRLKLSVSSGGEFLCERVWICFTQPLLSMRPLIRRANTNAQAR